MKMKNDDQHDYIKEAFDKLYNCVMPYIDLTQISDAIAAFNELDKKVHSEIYILKKCLDERDRAVEALKKENSELKTRNERLKTTCESRLKALFEVRIEAAQYKKSFMEHYEENDRLRGVVDVLEKEINTLKKKIHELEEENIHKRPWHGDGNAMTGGRTCCESLAETIEFQNKKIEELEAEKVGLKEAYDIHETTIKRLKLLLDEKGKEKEVPTGDHEFEFGDKVLVPWSDVPYMYIKTSLMYNPRTKSLVYVGKDQHLKWLGYKFVIK